MTKDTPGPTDPRSEQQSERQQAQKSHNLKTKERTFQAGDTVNVCNFPGGTWIQGIIDKTKWPPVPLC